jgi:putative ABC transport system permease protein
MSLFGVAVAAYQEVRANVLRTAITMLGVVIGVGAFTVVVAAGAIATAATRAFIEREFGRPATLQLAFEGLQPAADQVERLESMLEDVGVPAFAPLSSGEGHFLPTRDNPGAVFTLIGTSSQLANIRRIEVLAGRWLNPADARRRGPVLVVNEALTAAAGLSTEQALGARLTLAAPQTVEARIVGVVSTGITDSGQPTAYAPLAAVSAWGVHEGPTSYLLWIHPGDQRTITAALARLTSRWDTGTPAVYRIDTGRNLEAVVEQQRVVLTVVAAVALAIGGLSLLNMGLVTARQRVKEFGIHKSFGATTSEVFMMVLAESILTSLAAGIIGVGLAIAATALLPGIVIGDLPTTPRPSFPMSAALAGVSVSAVIGLLAGFIPAVRATQQPTITSMRG